MHMTNEKLSAQPKCIQASIELLLSSSKKYNKKAFPWQQDVK